MASEPSASNLGDPAAFYRPSRTERHILSRIHRAGDITQAELTRLVDLAQPSVSRLISAMTSAGLIKVGAAAAQRRGHPSATLRLNPDYAFGLGIALLGDSLACSVVDFCGQVRWQRSQPMASMARGPVLDGIQGMRTEMLASTGIDPGRLFAAGAGISAFFIGDGPLMNPPHLLDEWALVDIGEILRDALGIPVLVENDGNVACIGEAMLGAGRRFRSFAYFQITNGFGGGLILDGRPHRGSFGNAGEFAALWQSIGIEHPNLEYLRRLLVENGADYASVSDMLVLFDIDAPGVEQWLDKAAPAFSLAATAASAVVDCEAIVLGGRIPHSLAERLASRIEIAGTDRRGHPRPLPIICSSELEGDAVSVGAAAFALQSGFFGAD